MLGWEGTPVTHAEFQKLLAGLKPGSGAPGSAPTAPSSARRAPAACASSCAAAKHCWGKAPASSDPGIGSCPGPNFAWLSLL